MTKKLEVKQGDRSLSLLCNRKVQRRRGTRAAQFQDQVEEKVKQDRLFLLQKIQKEITREKNQALEGRMAEVLVEGQRK